MARHLMKILWYLLHPMRTPNPWTVHTFKQDPISLRSLLRQVHGHIPLSCRTPTTRAISNSPMLWASPVLDHPFHNGEVRAIGLRSGFPRSRNCGVKALPRSRCITPELVQESSQWPDSVPFRSCRESFVSIFGYYFHPSRKYTRYRMLFQHCIVHGRMITGVHLFISGHHFRQSLPTFLTGR